MRGYGRRLGLSALCIALGACHTPGSVRELAGRTAVHTKLVDAQLKSLVKQSRQVGEMRANHIAFQRGINRQVAARHELDGALTAKTETGLTVAYTGLVAWVEKATKIFTAGRVDEPAMVREILAKQKTAEPLSKELGAVAKALATLEKKDSVGARAKFIIGYVREVTSAVEAAKKDAEKATASAAAESSKARKTAKEDKP